MTPLQAAMDRVRRAQKETVALRFVYLPDRNVDKYADWVDADRESAVLYRKDLEVVATAYLALHPVATAMLDVLIAVYEKADLPFSLIDKIDSAVADGRHALNITE